MTIYKIDFSDVYLKDVCRKVLTKIIFSQNEFSIKYGKLPRQMEVDRGTYILLSEIPGFYHSEINNTNLLGSLNGISIYLDENKPMCVIHKPRVEAYWKLFSDNGLSEEYYINKDIQRDREESIEQLLNE